MAGGKEKRYQIVNVKKFFPDKIRLQNYNICIGDLRWSVWA